MKIALLGFGLEGRSAYHYFRGKFPDTQFTVYENAEKAKYDIPETVTFVGGVKDFRGLKADIIVRTPAIAPQKISGLGRITSATKEFFASCPAPIIGVTGTKGKGTTCSLITEILKRAGKKVWLVGNIGAPALDVLSHIKSDDIVVYELSSFQLWDMEQSPHIAVVLMIEPDHMDVHSSLVEYVFAKSKIGLYQAKQDVMIYHPTNTLSAQIAKASPSLHKKRYASAEAAHVESSAIMIDGEKICLAKDVGLIGQHNIENICAAVSAAWHFTQDVAAIAAAVKNFKGLEHRLEFVRELGGVQFYNDSFSSAPGATLAAVKAFSGPEIIIIGGHSKNIGFDDFAGALAEQKNIKKILLIGETQQAIGEALKKAGVTQFERVKTTDFSEIIRRAAELAVAGDVVLLSPGCASFGMFQNFYERGQQFKTIVKKLS